MRSPALLPLLCLSLVGGCDSSPAATMADAGSHYATTTAADAAFAQLVTDTSSFLTRSGTPGASIAVVLHGQLAFAAGVGLRNVADGAPVTTSTRFRVASMSKMVVAATAMTLVEEGKLDLTAPLTRYVPWFELATGFDASQITMDELLSHASGFPCDTLTQCGATTSGARESFFADNPQPLWAPPGAIYDYSNAGYALAATVIEAAAGASDGDFDTLAHDRVLVPVGMTTATYDASATTSGEHATGYDLDANGKVVDAVEPDALACPLLDPPGGIAATATDYAHFAEMLLANGGSVLKPSSVAAMEAPHVSTHELASQSYGYGLLTQLSPYPDHVAIWHNGGLPGFTSEMWLVPDDQVAVVVLVNGNGSTVDAQEIVDDALALFIPEATTLPALSTDPSQWTEYVGRYDDAYGTLGAAVDVSLTGTGESTALVVDAPNALDYEGQPAPVTGAMTQMALDTWTMPDGTLVSFFPDAGGTTHYFVTRRGVAVRE